MVVELSTIKGKVEESAALKRSFIDLLADPEVRQALIAALDRERLPGPSHENRRLFI